MAAVEGRNRDDVHEGEGKREECGDVPEAIPTHFSGNILPMAPKPPMLFGPSLEKNVAERADIVAEGGGAETHAARYRP